MTSLLHQRLSDAAKAGDIDDLYVVLEQDSGILEVIDQNPFTNTPLHVAVSAGQACFAEEITNLKPSFVRKLNPNGYSPLHLAASNGHVEMVRQLLKVDSSLARLQGREKRTPLHCAAMVGNIEALDELIFNCHSSLQMLTVRKETALHLAVEHGQLETVQTLLNWIGELNMESLLSWKNQQGNTVLHLATSSRQHQIVKILCSGYRVRRAVKVNTTNNNGMTAFDLDESLRHKEEPLDVRNISKILFNAGSKQARDMKINTTPPSPPTKQSRLAIYRHQRMLHLLSFRVPEDTSLDVRNAMLVILVLIATATFQVGISPPGGLLQDLDHHLAGFLIWLINDSVGYHIFSAVNFVGFLLSSVLIIKLVEGYPYSGPVRLAQSLLVFTYVLSAPYFPFRRNVVTYILLGVLAPVGSAALLWIYRKHRQFP